MNSANVPAPRADALLTARSQSLIQQEWASAGKPHNFICSKCRKPGNLILCSTCCRSYHVACLPAPPSAEGAASWSCPACQQRLSSPVVQSPTPELLTCERAKRFLSGHGLPVDGRFSPQFLLQLEQLIAGTELQSQTARELEQLRNENLRLKEENQRLKGNARASLIHDSFIYDRQRSPPVPHGYTADPVEVSRLDVAEKSWDRIISEAF